MLFCIFRLFRARETCVELLVLIVVRVIAAIGYGLDPAVKTEFELIGQLLRVEILHERMAHARVSTIEEQARVVQNDRLVHHGDPVLAFELIPLDLAKLAVLLGSVAASVKEAVQD